MSCDNARAEGLFGLLEQESLYSRDVFVNLWLVGSSTVMFRI